VTTVGCRTSSIFECSTCHTLLEITVELTTPTETATILGGLAFVERACDCGGTMQTVIKFKAEPE
jgi:hypothetical protein